MCVHPANDCWSKEQEAESQHAVAKISFSVNFAGSNEECMLHSLCRTVSVFILTSSARKCQYIEVPQLNFVGAVNFFMAEQCHCWQLD